MANGSNGAIAALAQAYFRCALLQRADVPRQSTLRRAALLVRADLRFAYHLRLALHRAGGPATRLWPRAGCTARYRVTATAGW